jgi:PTH1 family peptidyl-tRNA hydrolase
VLQDFAKADAAWLDDLMRGIAEGAPWLARDKPERFQTAVAQRMAPAKPEKTRPKPEAETKSAPAPDAPEEDARSALQKLMDRFR